VKLTRKREHERDGVFRHCPFVGTSEARRTALQRLCRHKGCLSGNLSYEPRSGRAMDCLRGGRLRCLWLIQQRRIAQEAYGDFDKVTMDSGLAVLKPLERIWKDDDSVCHSLSLSVLSLEVDFRQCGRR
jgi:hypothetical protein